jgi:ABC-type amino acid transport substrate-binding protein
MKRRLASWALCLWALASVAASEEPLVIGMELEYPPFEFVGDDGNPDGVSVRMAEALGEYLRRPVESYKKHAPCPGVVFFSLEARFLPSLCTGSMSCSWNR